jgi:hypothetical protein
MSKLIIAGGRGEEHQVLAGVRRWQHVQYSMFGARAKQTDSDINCGLYKTFSTFLINKYSKRTVYCVSGLLI